MQQQQAMAAHKLHEARAASTRAVSRAMDKVNDKSAELELRRADLEMDGIDERLKELHAQIDELEGRM
jgi:hypothetical protein